MLGELFSERARGLIYADSTQRDIRQKFWPPQFREPQPANEKLHMAIWEGQPELVRGLLRQGGSLAAFYVTGLEACPGLSPNSFSMLWLAKTLLFRLVLVGLPSLAWPTACPPRSG